MILRIAAVVSLSIAVSVVMYRPGRGPSAISIPGDQKSARQDRWKAIRCIPSRFPQRGRSAPTGVAAFDTMANATAGRSISSRSINPRLEFRVTLSNTQDLQNSSGTPSYAKALYIGVSGDVKVTMAGDKTNSGTSGNAENPVIFKAVPVGPLNIQVRRVWSTGTTAISSP